MARRARYLILAALVLSLGAGLSFFFLRGHLLKRPELLLEEAARRVDLRLQDVDYTQISKGRKEWTLKASRVDYLQQGEMFSLEDVHLLFYHPSGNDVTVVGRTGFYNRREGWIKVVGQGRVNWKSGFEMTAESFTYHLESRELTTPDEVLITGPGLRISGRGLQANLAQMKAVVKEQVQTELKPKERG